ncbi:hypothetical protein CC1G_09655 [Coprinopsis cinerea okayama7|uniref:Uncharacterized protein n=1 Tax=Coprinopsis cinerea (strain Okayama-7 / 130 / ATCC MYA-4618 / FGSC 9003) TaxID=240176 RepID=A8P9E1_COPC7|nr:hypothetical protein CC1G_09655 [Coprinopsis cinerea okayama7\|eukprot:XP_001839752.1 hypothetical protein CC1G_09655 [Coprinopsis cinerea okayama7\
MKTIKTMSVVLAIVSTFVCAAPVPEPVGNANLIREAQPDPIPNPGPQCPRQACA